MTEQRNALAEIFAKCWMDQAFKDRFMSDPKTVFSEYGLDVPDGMNIDVVENTDTCVHLTLPMPPNNLNNLSDSELSDVAGGCITRVANVPTG